LQLKLKINWSDFIITTTMNISYLVIDYVL